MIRTRIVNRDISPKQDTIYKPSKEALICLNCKNEYCNGDCKDLRNKKREIRNYERL